MRYRQDRIVYVIQVMARHGVGSQGWRTVRRPAGAPYGFRTKAAALTALQKHFPTLREGRDVRVHILSDGSEAPITPVMPMHASASSTLPHPSQHANPCSCSGWRVW